MLVPPFLLLFLVIASCNNGKGVINSDTKSSPPVTDTILPYQGTWVIKKHIDTLLYYKSPSRSQGTEYFMSFPKSINAQAYSYVYHEGGGEYNVIKHGTSYFIVSQASDTMEVVMLAGGETLKVGKDTFVKIPEGVGVPKKCLFAGEYKCNDRVVRFTRDDKVSGLDSLQYYGIQNDYLGPGYGSVDIVFLGTQKDPTAINCFEFVADTLLIYDVKCLQQDAEGTCMDLEKGTLKYKLVSYKR